MNFLLKNTAILPYIFILLHINLHLSKAERRILDGKDLTEDKRYVVYMIKANDTVLYDTWICGGAIVSTWIIITSAACVEDVKHMYAIAGYNQNVHYEELNDVECTKQTKKKIVYAWIPRSYKFDYPDVARWANIDIALVKVEKPYDFADKVYYQNNKCSYTPNKIPINYEEKYQKPDTDALVFGWGHVKKWRDMEDTIDYNSKNLQYGMIKLADKEECKKHFKNEQLKNIIEKHMICSMEQGKINDAGDNVQEGDGADDNITVIQHCGKNALRIGGECVPLRNIENLQHFTRRRGICQNDHGGPIITWRGPKEILIGIASVFRVEDGNCMPPFLYTSTHCNGGFIHCLMKAIKDGQQKEEDVRQCDNLAKTSKIKLIRRAISWIGHPDGPAENEIESISKAERRILDGMQLSKETNSRFVVYLIKANDKILYDAWICGGAIISPSVIVTSAACVEDVEHMYAIAGYTKYVRYENLNNDACTKETKRKIVYKCVPKDYTFDYTKINQWANIDIALAKVEKPYDFSDQTYLAHKCSYIPNGIQINFDLKLQEPGIDAFVFGWGHTEKWRSENDTVDHNQAELLYGSVKLARNEECKTHYNDPQFQDIIDKYMICSNDQDDQETKLYASNCKPQALRMGEKCVYLRLPKHINYLTRRSGICQNDHGGPIIVKDETQDLLIGIASVFKLEDGTDRCIGPFLYTSTHCSAAFIVCVMKSLESGNVKNVETRRCDDLARQNGMNIQRKNISWIGHPDGPAYNEMEVEDRL